MQQTGSYDLTNERIKDTYQRVTQVSGSGTPTLLDGLGNEIKGLKLQEAFERDANGDLQPTTGSFYDMFWEENEDGDKQPRDIKFWLDENYNLIPLE